MGPSEEHPHPAHTLFTHPGSRCAPLPPPTLLPFLSSVIMLRLRTFFCMSASVQMRTSGFSSVLSLLSTRADSFSILMMTPAVAWSNWREKGEGGGRGGGRGGRKGLPGPTGEGGGGGGRKGGDKGREEGVAWSNWREEGVA